MTSFLIVLYILQNGNQGAEWILPLCVFSETLQILHEPSQNWASH